MSYNKQNFVNGQPLTAQQLNHIENGIVQLDTELNNVNTEITNIEDNYATKDFVRSEINNAEIGGDGELDVDLSIYALKTEIPKYIQTGALSDSTIGFNATVEGASNIASGDYSHAEGNYTAASEENSHAEGRNSRASGQSSHAEGSSTQATASSAHAEGSLTQATGAYAHAEGYRTVASEYASHAEGVWTTASGYAPHAEGNMTTASGYASHAEGDKTTASGYDSHAEGGYLYSDEEGYLEEFIIDDLNTSIISTTAEGIQSHAEGTQTLAYGYSSHSEGYRTVASGDYSHAEGDMTTASGDYSHAEGRNTLASSSDQHVQGRYNIEDTNDTYAHIVGNGSSTTRSNAYTLDWDGNAWFAGAINCENKTTTLANLGAAPAVYTYPSINGLDANTIVNEYHKFVINCSNCAYPHGFLDVEKAGGEGFTPNGAVPIIQQTMREWSTGHKAYRTSVDNGATWGEWIYETPPLVHNVEYRTTERLSNSPVYVRYIHIGSIPANGEITADVGIAANKLVSLEIMSYSSAYNVAMPLPHMDSNNNSISMIGWLTGGVIHVKSFVSFTGYSAFAIIKYTK